MFLERVYYGLFYTIPDPIGFTTWTNSLNQGTQTRSQAALALFQQSQVQTSGFDTVAAYISVLGRDPDYGGYLYWTRLFHAGVLATPQCLAANPGANTNCSQLTLLTSFMQSPEFQTRFSAADNASFVSVVYQNVLGRSPDPSGFSFWLNGLNKGLSRAQMLVSFITSPEFQISFGNRIQVDMAYCAFLQRVPTQAEIATWTSALSSGATVSNMISSLITSPEFKAGL